MWILSVDHFCALRFKVDGNSLFMYICIGRGVSLCVYMYINVELILIQSHGTVDDTQRDIFI